MPTLGQVQLVSEEKQVLNPSFNIIKEQACFRLEGKVGERTAAPSYHTDSPPPHPTPNQCPHDLAPPSEQYRDTHCTGGYCFAGQSTEQSTGLLKDTPR